MQFLVFLLLILFFPAVFYAGWIVGFLFLQYGLGEPRKEVDNTPQLLVALIGLTVIMFTGSLLSAFWQAAGAIV